MSRLDNIIHQPARLRIMATLMALDCEDQAEFTYLRQLLNLTDGNLGAHLRKLEDAGYIAVEKAFVARKPRTFLSATTKGRGAFEDHVAALKAIVEGEESKI